MQKITLPTPRKEGICYLTHAFFVKFRIKK